MENPVIKEGDLAAESANLRSQLEAGEKSIDTPSANEQPEPRAPGTEKTETDPKPNDKKDGDAPEKKEPKPAELKQEEKPNEGEETPYARAKRKQAEEWQRLEKTKANLAERERKLAERERQPAPEANKQSAKSERPTFPDGQGGKLSSTDLYKHAAKLATDDPELSTQCRAEAEKLEAEEQEWDKTNKATAQQTEAQQKLQQQFDADFTELKKLDADFATGGTEKAKRMEAFIGEYPWLADVPGGLLKAREVLMLQDEAGQVPELRKQIETLTAERDGLRRRTGLGGGGPTPQGGGKSLESMSIPEATAYLRNKAAEQGALT